MTLSESILAEARAAFALTEKTPPRFAKFCYPRRLALMRFTVHQSGAPFGNLATMDTVAMGGLMRLSTIVFTPSCGRTLPVLLIDTMEMKRKKLAYVEYYDCTAAGAQLPEMASQRAEFAALPDYAEKPAWYVQRRMPCSLIKGGTDADGQALREMALTCVRRYLLAAQTAADAPENRAKLSDFRRDMVEKGNPSSATLDRVLGKQDARTFFETVIMPIENERSFFS